MKKRKRNKQATASIELKLISFLEIEGKNFLKILRVKKDPNHQTDVAKT